MQLAVELKEANGIHDIKEENQTERYRAGASYAIIFIRAEDHKKKLKIDGPIYLKW